MDYEDISTDFAENLFPLEEIILDKKTWDNILKAKLAYLEKGEDPRLVPDVRLEIAESWIRSHEAGIDPKIKKMCTPVSDQEYEKIRSHYRPLINTAQHILSVLNEADITNDYIFELVNKDGVSLVRTGNLDLHKYVERKSIFNEKTMGTNAHTLCMRHKVPVQIIGPEHYAFNLHDLAASAAPIISDRGEVIASLLLTQPLPDAPFTDAYHKILEHKLGLITSFAYAIQAQVKFQHYKEKLYDVETKINSARITSSRIRHVLESTVNTSKENLIILDGNGIIQQLSPEASHALKMSPNMVRGKKVSDFFDLIWPEDFRDILASQDKKTISFAGNMYSLYVNSVVNEDTGGYDAIILHLEKKSEQIKTQEKIGDIAQVTFDDILGSSPAMADAIKLARRFATTNENVLIVGESGTGKEYFAQAIHNIACPNGPFMSINCAAIPPRLIESELFGYESGSFTGAERGGKPGKIELAHGGTLFLDEIGDMPLELQATLLRVLENKRVMRIGGKGYKQVDFRVMAATNRDLHTMVQDNIFREDLLYRLSILTIELPPLRERADDKMFFAQYFLNECHRKNTSGPRVFADKTIEIINCYAWPGNVRQMKNTIFSSFYAAQDNMITPHDLPPYIVDSCTTKSDSDHPFVENEYAVSQTMRPQNLSLRELEKAAIETAMKRADGTVAQAAHLLEISKATLYRKLKEYEIEY